MFLGKKTTSSSVTMKFLEEKITSFKLSFDIADLRAPTTFTCYEFGQLQCICIIYKAFTCFPTKLDDYIWLKPIEIHGEGKNIFYSRFWRKIVFYSNIWNADMRPLSKCKYHWFHLRSWEKNYHLHISLKSLTSFSNTNKQKSYWHDKITKGFKICVKTFHISLVSRWNILRQQSL